MALLLGLKVGSKTCRAEFIPAEETTVTNPPEYRSFCQADLVMLACYMAEYDESNRGPTRMY